MSVEKMKFETPDMTAGNVEKIAELFPNCVTEMRDENGKVKRGINFEMLKQMLSPDVVDGDECYEFTWVGKKASVVEANKPIRKTLRPCPEESKDWDITENLYIEGDNLEVLKLLQESYLGKVKMIYIDPPYNTGNDFIYADDFMRSQEEENEQMGMYDEEDNRLFKNTDSNGRFHSDWCSMIYSRLLVARNLLSDEGIIFISIDDNEQENLKKICDDVFGAGNFVAQIVVEGTPKNDPKIISTAHEYCLVYVKSFAIAKDCQWGIDNPIYKDLLSIVSNASSYQDAERRVKEYYKANGLADDNISNYCRVDERGLFRIGPIDDPQNGGPKDTRYNPFTGQALKTPNSGWRCPISTWREWVKNGEVLFPEDNTKLCSRKVYIKEDKLDLLRAYFKIQTRKDTDMLKTMFGKKVFSFPKPVELIKAFIDSSTQENEIVMDFFSGSATTAHAVMQLNADRIGKGKLSKVKFILVQLQENLYENLAHATGNREKMTCQNAIDFCLENGLEPVLTSIGKERIRRAGEKIKAESGLTAQNLDVGFRVLKLADSNMKDVYYAADDYKQADLFDMISNIKDDRTDLDLLFGCLIDWGLPLSMPYTSEQIEGCTVHTYNDGDLIACFDENIPESVVKEIASRKPLRAVFRDSSFANSPAKINVFEIFKLYMPEDADDISKRVRVI